MDQLQTGILTLMKSAIAGKRLDLPEGFSLEEALPVIKKHNVIPLAYEGAVQCGIPLNLPVMKQLLQGYCKHMLYSEGQMKAVQRIFDAFDANHIDYMPFKGCNMKALYPKPELRLMGDADVLIRVEQYPQIKPILKGMGFEEQSENAHELPWDSKELHLELHKSVMPSANRDFYSYYGNGWGFAQHRNGNRYSFSTEDEFIFMFAHFSKHYRSGGIGIRHVVDLWVYQRSFPEMDENYLYAELEKLHLQEFYKNICRLIDCWFENGAADERTDFIGAFIFNCGSWGTIENSVLASEFRKVRNAGDGQYSKVCAFFSSAFPGRTTLEYQYPVLKKMPYLLPAVWIVRLFSYMLNRRSNVKRRWRAMQRASSEEGREYVEALKYVGLEYRPKEF